MNSLKEECISKFDAMNHSGRKRSSGRSGWKQFMTSNSFLTVSTMLSVILMTIIVALTTRFFIHANQGSQSHIPESEINHGSLANLTLVENLLKSKGTSPNKGFDFIPASAHKQLRPSMNFTGTASYIGHYDTLLIPNYHDPLTEHVEGVALDNYSLIIQYPGLYYVYSSVHFSPMSDCLAGDNKIQSWFHFVYRISQNDPGISGELLQTAHTVCNTCASNEETAFTGAVFYLETNDRIKVCFSGFGVVKFNKESSFVGLVRIAGDKNDDKN